MRKHLCRRHALPATPKPVGEGGFEAWAQQGERAPWLQLNRGEYKVEFVAGSLCRGVAEHGDRAPWLQLRRYRFARGIGL